jgi:copper(I)-binding protein
MILTNSLLPFITTVQQVAGIILRRQSTLSLEDGHIMMMKLEKKFLKNTPF